MNKTSNKYLSLCIYLALVLTTIIAFEQVRYNNFVDYDDHEYITENSHVQAGLTRESILWAFTTQAISNWHPLTWLSHMLDCQLFGVNPAGHHIVNVLFHIINTLLLFAVFKKMTGAVWPSAFIAAAFALHPQHTESVAWAAERKDVLSTLFWLLTMAAYVRYTKKLSVSSYLPVILFFALGLMAKPMLVTLPFVLLLLDFWPLNRLQPVNKINSAGRLIAEKIPLFVLAAASSLVTFLAQQSGGAMNWGRSFPLTVRISNALFAYLCYIGKMFYPTRLAVLYPHPGFGLATYKPVISFAILLLLSAAVICFSRRRRYLATGWLWFIGTLVPVIGLVQVGAQIMANRYTYVPSIGIFIIVAWGSAELLAKFKYKKIVLAVSASLVLTAMLICTRAQVLLWKNELTLFGHAVAVTSDNYIMRHDYGVALSDRGLFDEAFIQYKESVRINPEYDKPHNNLGAVFAVQGDYDQAIKHFSIALRIKPANENAHNNIARAFFLKGQIADSVRHYKESIRLEPDDPEVISALAWVLATTKDSKFRNAEEAVQLAENACRLTDYNQPEILDILSIAYAAAEKFDKAVEFAEKAIPLAQAEGKENLAKKIQSRLKSYKAK